MREDLLHYVWKSQRFPKTELTSSSSNSISVIHPGQHNSSSGPDFFNARICIDGQEWAGNVEIHLKSSDWYAHHHEQDVNYNNVILHVVWEDDAPIFRKDGTAIPTLVLKDYIEPRVLHSYQKLVYNKKYKFANCEGVATEVDEMIWGSWHQRLFVERLEQKSKLVREYLAQSNNDWEAMLFIMLMKNFGLNKNGNSFLAVARHMDFGIIKKVRADLLQLESFFYGTIGFLEDENIRDEYYLKMQTEFKYLKHKFRLTPYNGERPVFYGLRPLNFPTIRLSQLSNLLHGQPNLFGKVMDAKTLKDFYLLLQVNASDYWNTHYTFGKPSSKRKKGISKNFIHLLLINTIVPLRFWYAKFRGKDETEELMDLMMELPPENNAIIEGYKGMGVLSESAFESQAKIELFNGYCSHNRCLNCHIGVHLLGRKS